MYMYYIITTLYITYTYTTLYLGYILPNMSMVEDFVFSKPRFNY